MIAQSDADRASRARGARGIREFPVLAAYAIDRFLVAFSESGALEQRPDIRQQIAKGALRKVLAIPFGRIGHGCILGFLPGSVTGAGELLVAAHEELVVCRFDRAGAI